MKYLFIIYEGKLQEIDDNGDFTGEGFKFDFYDTHSKNQRRYEAIGEILNEEVYDLLVSRGNLEKVMVGRQPKKSTWNFQCVKANTFGESVVVCCCLSSIFSSVYLKMYL